MLLITDTNFDRVVVEKYLRVTELYKLLRKLFSSFIRSEKMFVIWERLHTF